MVIAMVGTGRATGRFEGRVMIVVSVPPTALNAAYGTQTAIMNARLDD